MFSSYEPKVLEIRDIEPILAYEKSRLEESVSDDMEREFASWHSPWRQEALEHYLPLGWSFGLFSPSSDLVGYFLAQPLVFYKALTQSLWVEHLSATTSDVSTSLLDLAYRLCRDKHLQALLVPQELQNFLPPKAVALDPTGSHCLVKTARF